MRCLVPQRKCIELLGRFGIISQHFHSVRASLVGSMCLGSDAPPERTLRRYLQGNLEVTFRVYEFWDPLGIYLKSKTSFRCHARFWFDKARVGHCVQTLRRLGLIYPCQTVEHIITCRLRMFRDEQVLPMIPNIVMTSHVFCHSHG